MKVAENDVNLNFFLAFQLLKFSYLSSAFGFMALINEPCEVLYED
jgi:hypothetical protein